MNPDAKTFLDAIEIVRTQAAEYAGFFHKLKDRLTRAEKNLGEKSAILSVVSALLSDLQAARALPEQPAVSQLIQSLEQQLQKARQHFTESFPADLRQECEAAHLHFANLQNGFGVGPFFVAPNFPKEIASFHYAKVDMGVDVPLTAKSVVQHATTLKAALIDLPADLAKFGDDLYEAMRVAAARQNKPSKTELRVELPLIFHEMLLNRQFPAAGTRQKPARNEYSLPRFVIELKQFVQSEQNTRSSRPFRPEPAVIENAKNPKKSIFIPHDLARGFGEGTYFQAVVVRQD